MILLAERKKRLSLQQETRPYVTGFRSRCSRNRHTHNNVVMLMCCDHNSLMEKKKDPYPLTFPCQDQ